MRCFVRGNALDVGVDFAVEACGGEVRFREVGEAFAVEFVFEVLEGECVAEDVDWMGLLDLSVLW